MRAAFYQVLGMSATASVVILIVLALRLCMRKAPKVYSYALWSVVLFRLLCPFSIESGLSILPRQTAATQTEIAQYEAVEAGEEYLAAYHAMGDALNGGLDYIDVKLEPEYVQTLEEEAQQDTISLTHGEVWALLLSSLWPVGALLLLGRSFVSMWKLKRSLRGATHLRDNIYLTANIQTPFTMGLLRPAIYLPEGLGEHEQDYIICHEQYHIRRGDHIVKVLAFIALCLHWFNPLVWLAFHLAGKDMEMSCDEAVVKQMGAHIRADYSQSLLTLATGRHMAVGTHLAFGDGDTKGRIKNVLNWKKPKVWVSILAVVVCVIAAAVCIADPAQPIDTDKIGAVTYMEWSELDGPNGLSDPADRHPVYGTSGVPDPWKSQLFDLINSHSATRRFSLPDWEPRSHEMENRVRLSMQREGYFELASWYVNGFSFSPFHYGEDEYDTTLAQYTADGKLVACWTMDYDFDRPFRELLQELNGVKDMAEALDDSGDYYHGTGITSLKPGQTEQLYREIVLAEDGSTVTYETSFSMVNVGLIAEDGMRYIHSIGVVEENLEDGVGSFRDLPAGRYRPFVKNRSDTEETVGIARFHLTSPKDKMQEPQEQQANEEEQDPRKRVWNFEDLKPGQTFYFTENIVRGGDESTFVIQTTYAPSELTLELGLVREDGHAKIDTVERGGLHSTITFLNGRAEEYSIFIRNVDKGDGDAASGSIIIELSSEQDYFQRSTPFVPATVFDRAERVMVRGNLDVPEASKTALIRLLNQEVENWQDTHIPEDFALRSESNSEVRIRNQDGSWYLLEGWHDESSANGYRTTLTWKDPGFHVVGTWIMDDDFNASYHEWLGECYTRMALDGREKDELTAFGQMMVQHPDDLSVAPVLYQAILDHHRSNQSGQYFCCADFVVLANEERTRYDPATGSDMKTRNYFLWVLYQEYLFTEDGIVEEAGAHIPTNITLGENADGSWSVLNYWEPGDGTYYAQDIQATFPGDSVNDALDSQKYIMAQKQNCYEQAVEYAKTDSDVKMDVDAVIEGLLDVVCSSPMESSNPKDYAADHPVEYRELKFYGDYTREYCARQLQLENGEMGLRERIMEMLMGELNL